MLKKVSILLLALMASICFVAFGCADDGTHVHGGTTGWEKDQDNHWKVCVCKENYDLSAHQWNEGEITIQPTHVDVGEKTFACTVCGATKTEEIAVASHEFGEYKVNGEKHWKQCACGAKSDEQVHSYDQSGACVCGWTKKNVDAIGWASAFDWDAVDNFTYDTTLQNGQRTYNLADDEPITMTVSSQTTFTTEANKGKMYSYSEYGEKIVQNMNGYSNTSQSTNYYSVESGVEYNFAYYEYYDMYVKSLYSNISDITFVAGRHAGLSVFRNAIEKYSTFEYDNVNGWYINTEPMQFSVQSTSNEGSQIVESYTNCIFKFKMLDGDIEWMSLDATQTLTFTYASSWTLEIEGVQMGRVQSTCESGEFNVTYHSVGATSVTLPSEFLLDPTIENYPCQHENATWNRQEYFHKKDCTDCGATIIFEAHEYMEGSNPSTGVCLVCEYACLHSDSVSNYNRVDDQKHVGYCMACYMEIEENHSFNEQNYCEKCDYTLCLHVNREMAYRQNNEQHGFSCNDCYQYINENHNYDGSNYCEDCNSYRCEHADLDSVDYQYNSQGHYKNCPNCGDSVLQDEHILNGDNCTVCDYEVCYHTNIQWIAYEYEHSAMCPGCNEYVQGEHSLVSGECSVCGYDENCDHSQTKKSALSSERHVTVCSACGLVDSMLAPEEHDWTNSDGVCKDCGYICAHEHGSPAYEGGEPKKDSEGHFMQCYTCFIEYKEQHVSADGNDEQKHYQYCVACFHQWNEENHDWSNGTCTQCEWVCQHMNYNEGVCDYCGHQCPHEWSEYDESEYSHTRACSICYKYEYAEHSWVEGVCEVCEYDCQHPYYNEGICSVCEYACPHDWQEYNKDSLYHFRTCELCGKYESEIHNWTNGACSTCQYQCPHDYYNEGICYNCSYACTHTWSEWNKLSGEDTHTRVCSICELQQYSACSKDTEGYDVATEQGCAKTCKDCLELFALKVHNMEGTSCLDCGYNSQCQHVWSCTRMGDNYTWHKAQCSECNAMYGLDGKQTHNYTDNNGICVGCGDECQHHSKLNCESNGNGGHTFTCGYCNLNLEENCILFEEYTQYIDKHFMQCRYCNEQYQLEYHAEDELCETCGYNGACTHDSYVCIWENYEHGYDGHRFICNYCYVQWGNSQHNYVYDEELGSGVCSDCEYQCYNHRYVNNNVCICGKPNPDV